MLNIYVIGCGGIGGYLINMLPMCICSLSLDLMQKVASHKVQDILKNTDSMDMPLCADRIVLVDGDTFDPRNAIRQGHGAGNKLVQRMRELDSNMLRRTLLRTLDIRGYNAYVNPDNMRDIIPEMPEPNENNTEAHQYFAGKLYNNNVIFLCVDNAKTRYEISMYAETLPDVIVINGGNEKTVGHVTVYERRNNEAYDPNLPEIYSDIRGDVDKRPDEQACELVAPKHDQIAVTNSIVANVMMAMFNKWARSGVPTNKRDQRLNEVLIDTENFVMTPLAHPKATKEEGKC